jgi:hypothetical protein
MGTCFKVSVREFRIMNLYFNTNSSANSYHNLCVLFQCLYVNILHMSTFTTQLPFTM